MPSWSKCASGWWSLSPSSTVHYLRLRSLTKSTFCALKQTWYVKRATFSSNFFTVDYWCDVFLEQITKLLSTQLLLWSPILFQIQDLLFLENSKMFLFFFYNSRNFRIFCFRDNVEKLRTTFMEQLVEILSLFAREGQRNKGGV